MTVIPESIRQWLTKPGYVQYVRHAYAIGGYEILPNIGLDLDEHGLEWVRTFNLINRKTGVEYRMIEPEDLCSVIVRAEERICKYYRMPGACV